MNQTEHRIRLGILVNSFRVQSWQRSLIERIKKLPFIDICLVIKNEAKPSPRSFSNFLYFKYVDWERRYSALPRDMYETVEVSDLLDGIDKLSVNPEQRGPFDRFPTSSVEKIKEYKLDVIIRLGFRILRGDILSTPKCGVWSYHHCDHEVIRGNPPGFYEVMLGHTTTGCILQILEDELDDGIVLFQSWSLTHPNSVAKNRAQNFWKSVTFIPRLLTKLHAEGTEAFMNSARANSYTPSIYDRPLYRNPTNWEMVLLTPRIIWLHLWPKLRDLFFQHQWRLLYSFSTDRSLSLRRFQSLIPPKDRFWADPFVVSREGKHYIYFEDADMSSGVGKISMVVLDRSGSVSEPVAILEKPYHLSYPFVFRIDDRYFMIPETEHNKTIELYECLSFPDKWQHKMNLMEDIRAVDVTPMFYNGKWWLFMNMVEEDGASLNDELFLFYGDDIFSKKWTPHPLNPIVSDIRRARPAGPIFSRNGQMYRPSQNPGGFNLNRIVEISETSYHEDTVCVVKPDWDSRCRRTHTFVQGDGITLVDGWYRKLKL